MGVSTYCIIAAPQQGKTTLCKRLIGNKPALVFDTNGEWPEMSNDTKEARSRFFGDPDKFLELCQTKHGGTFCLFEDATGFVSGAAQKRLKQALSGKRHPLEFGGRNYIFLYHTIGSVPPFILDMADYIVLFKTGDDLKTVERKRRKLVEPFQRLQRSTNHSKIIIKNI